MEALFWQRLPATKNSLPTARHAALAALEAAGITHPILLRSIALALSEAVGNAIVHAYPDDASREVEVTIVRDDHRVTVTVADEGVGLERAAQGPGLGLGQKLIHELASSSEIDSSADGTTVTMRFSTR
ncbi:MAG TPA: ATP-binding protein [Gaiellales bacterium]|nr:ATP-binding protein [Gaiellales bacterium]